jgi:hypothetical protein
MIGINFSYPDIADKLRSPPWLELRVSRIEPGPPNTVWARGDTREVAYYWRNWDISPEERTRLMEDIVKQLIRDHVVDGFTLWWNWSTKRWQMNHRFAEGGGWSVGYCTQAEAEAIFATLQASHPDGPWKVKPEYVQDDALAREQFEKEQRLLSPAARQEKAIEDVFEAAADDRSNGQRELPLGEALRRAAEAVERGNVFLATLIAGEG